MRKYSLCLQSVPLSTDRLQQADCVLICTKHSAIDGHLIGQQACLIVDTRNAMQGIPCDSSRVLQA